MENQTYEQIVRAGQYKDHKANFRKGIPQYLFVWDTTSIVAQGKDKIDALENAISILYQTQKDCISDIRTNQPVIDSMRC